MYNKKYFRLLDILWGGAATSLLYTLEINMEPENHVFEKENHLNQTFIFGFKISIFRGAPFISRFC